MHAGFFFSPLYWACIQRQTDTKSKSHLAGCVHYIFIGGGGGWVSLGGKETPTTLKYDAKNSPSAGSVGVPVTRWSKRMDGGKEGMQMWNSNSNGLQGPRTTASALLGGSCTVRMFCPLGTGWVSRETDAVMGCINTKMYELFRVKYMRIEYLNLQFARGGILAAQRMNLHILLTKVNKRD